MSDPFDVLRGPLEEEVTPDIGAIKARARGIQRRRSVVLVGGAAAVLLIAFAGVALRPTSDEGRQLADGSRPTPTSLFSAETDISTPAAAAGAESSRSASKDAPAADSGSVSEGTAVSAPSEQSSSPLIVSLEARSRTLPRGADFTLKACNETKESVTQQFGSSQRYDFVVHQGDNEVWRWSNDMFFAQVVGKETWKPDECKTWTEAWDGTTSEGGAATAGSYEVYGILTTSKPINSPSSVVCLDIC